MAKGRAPKDFIFDYSGNVGAEFELWLEDLNDYLAIGDVTDADEKRRLFLNLARLGIRRIVKGLVIPTPADGSDVYKELRAAVMGHLRPATYPTAKLHKFRQVCQQPGESISSFVGRLRGKVDVCEFASTSTDSVENTQIRDQLIMGLESAEICKELLQVTSVTLNAAITKAVALETSITDSKLYDSRPGITSNHSSSSSSVTAVDEHQDITSLEFLSAGNCNTSQASFRTRLLCNAGIPLMVWVHFTRIMCVMHT